MSIVSLLSKTPMFKTLDRLEDELFARFDVVHPTGESPVRFEIMKETLKRSKGGPPPQMIPIIFPTMFDMQKSLRSLQNNPVDPKKHGDSMLFDEIDTLPKIQEASALFINLLTARIFLGIW